MSIGNRIKVLREERRISQTTLGELCGWDRPQTRISNYEKDLRTPKPEDALVLAKVLHSTAAYIMFGDTTELKVAELSSVYEPVSPQVQKLTNKLTSASPETLAVIETLLDLIQQPHRTGRFDSEGAPYTGSLKSKRSGEA